MSIQCRASRAISVNRNGPTNAPDCDPQYFAVARRHGWEVKPGATFAPELERDERKPYTDNGNDSKADRLHHACLPSNIRHLERTVSDGSDPTGPLPNRSLDVCRGHSGGYCEFSPKVASNLEYYFGSDNIVGARLRNVPQALKGQILNVERYSRVEGGEVGGKVGVFRQCGRRTAVSYSPKRAAEVPSVEGRGALRADEGRRSLGDCPGPDRRGGPL